MDLKWIKKDNKNKSQFKKFSTLSRLKYVKVKEPHDSHGTLKQFNLSAGKIDSTWDHF